MYKKLITKISSFITLTEEDIALVELLFEYRHCKKNEILINEGEYANSAYFVDSGYLRYYKIIDNGEEQTIHLVIPTHFATSLPSFLYNIKSEELLQSVVDSEVFLITRENLEKLYNTASKWQEFGRKLMEFFLMEKEQRLIDQLSLSAIERYKKLLDTDPQLIQNIPIQYIASFIGIKPESLSRIRKQIFS